ILFTSNTTETVTADEKLIEVLTLETGERKVLIQGGSYGRYLPTGHLVFLRSGTLMAVPFNLERLEVTGAPVNVIDGVRESGSGAEERLIPNAQKLTAISPISWLPDGNTLAFTDRGDIWLLPQSGERTPRPFIQSRFNEDMPAFSPDGHWLAYVSDESGRPEI